MGFLGHDIKGKLNYNDSNIETLRRWQLVTKV
jgi:hypothetical protein